MLQFNISFCNLAYVRKDEAVSEEEWSGDQDCGTRRLAEYAKTVLEEAMRRNPRLLD